jgi:SNF2 family DNA or RNA helicase
MNPEYSLYKYQSDAVEWMVEREKDAQGKFCGGILADEVGLGKTIMMTGVLLKNPRPNTLIILPKSLVLQWKTEVEKYTAKVEVVVVENDVINMNKDPKRQRLHIVSHSRFNKRGVEDASKLSYCQEKWDRVVIDEAHIIKNKKSKIHKAVSNLKTRIRWAMTATPVMNKMTDFVYTMKWVSNESITQLDCQIDHEKIVKKYLLRRTKTDVKEMNKQFELPKCTIEINKLNFETKDEKVLYETTQEKMREELLEMKATLGKQSIIYAMEMLLRARQICCYPQCYIDGLHKKMKRRHKLLGENAVLLADWTGGVTKLNFVKRKLEGQPEEDKTLIFCHFIKEMDLYEEKLRDIKMNVYRIDGSTDLESRNKIVEDFRGTELGKSVMLVQIDMGGQGFNFQCANRIFITSPTWNPSQQHQVIGRSHRTGQAKEVFVNILTIENEDKQRPYLETNILEIQMTKRKVIAELLQDPELEFEDCPPQTLTFEDVEAAFGL